jgi:putative holliday junction resolvase
VGRALGIDLGERRIGLALSDATRTLASPHSVVQRSKAHAHDHAAILRVVADDEVDTIVVGLPLSLNGDLGPAARGVMAEVDELRGRVPEGVEVVVHDERLTTVTAQAALIEARMRREARKRVVDKVAAAVMLQSWLDGQHARA